MVIPNYSYESGAKVMHGSRKTVKRIIKSVSDAVGDVFSKDQIEIHSNIYMLISGCRKLTEYSDSRVTMTLGRLALVVEGEGLEPESLINGQMAIRGIIKGVRYVDCQETD